MSRFARGEDSEASNEKAPADAASLSECSDSWERETTKNEKGETREDAKIPRGSSNNKFLDNMDLEAEKAKVEDFPEIIKTTVEDSSGGESDDDMPLECSSKQQPLEIVIKQVKVKKQPLKIVAEKRKKDPKDLTRVELKKIEAKKKKRMRQVEKKKKLKEEKKLKKNIGKGGELDQNSVDNNSKVDGAIDWLLSNFEESQQVKATREKKLEETQEKVIINRKGVQPKPLTEVELKLVEGKKIKNMRQTTKRKKLKRNEAQDKETTPLGLTVKKREKSRKGLLRLLSLK